MENSTLNLKISNLQKKSLTKEKEIREILGNIDFLNNDSIRIERQLSKENYLRRRLHNKLQELKGNIRVFCRVRPAFKQELFDGNTIEIEFPNSYDFYDQESIILKDPKVIDKISHPTYNGTCKKYDFKFDKVFSPSCSNGEIYEEISQLVQSAINGYNVCIFAYGQTGSGKTYTMSEPKTGMIPRSLEQIFENVGNLKQLSDDEWDFKIKGQFLEIYNENLIDLIGDNYNPNKKHEIRHDPIQMKTSVTDLTTVELKNPEQVYELLNKANKNRSTASTKANERSSRSHSVFIIKIIGTNLSTNERTEGCLNLIDLAGSERLSSSQATGNRLKETQSINKSLSCLGDVIFALSQVGSNNNSYHIPFRNSKLTYLLQYSLSGNSITLMFVNISPMYQHFSESINSLRFAMKVNNTNIGKAKRRIL
ncbi:hypothetical protein PACTADRAFT_52095 [Pachysolen tannophilus NRRL Y-2460]|uniref:Kinesin motor domain-containing protein n=1 Tax=Pachysolen tannophilus NRRL Y-2460 TaxID=669874 RepID=A0A1E4TP35_PACTA|nr:hypothetical protein PACTADRAFT_52095 [Pachysolen tannophilus NRRL Y-2460]